jgi:TonB family protein
MLPAIALSLALLTPQATTAQPQPNPAPATQTTLGPNPDASGVYHWGPGVIPPKVVYQVPPDYSEEARKKKLHGRTLVTLIVEANGNPVDIRIKESMADTVARKYRKAALSLDEKALEAVRGYRFAPATYQGNPVPFTLNIEISFQIF